MDRFGFSPMLMIRKATAADAGLLRTLIRELAEFERELDMVEIQEADLVRDGFGPNPRFRALIAEWNGAPAGYAVFFGYYSTWVGPGMYLEDLFVRSEFRGRGIGKHLLASVAGIAIEEKCKALRWEVLHWNEKAISLYEALGALFLDGWRTMMLSGDALEKLGEKSK